MTGMADPLAPVPDGDQPGSCGASCAPPRRRTCGATPPTCSTSSRTRPCGRRSSPPPATGTRSSRRQADEAQITAIARAHQPAGAVAVMRSRCRQRSASRGTPTGLPRRSSACARRPDPRRPRAGSGASAEDPLTPAGPTRRSHLGAILAEPLVASKEDDVMRHLPSAATCERPAAWWQQDRASPWGSWRAILARSGRHLCVLAGEEVPRSLAPGGRMAGPMPLLVVVPARGSQVSAS